MSTALLIVDVQNALVEAKPFNGTDVIRNINRLIEKARQIGVEVIYIQHDGGIGGEFEKNTKGWEIFGDIAPRFTDKVFDKNFNSSFKNTNLKNYLDSKGITTLILVGMKTEYCIDATCKSAFEQGYDLIIPKNATTTFDNDFFLAEKLVKYYEEKIWNKRYAQVMPVDEVVDRVLNAHTL